MIERDGGKTKLRKAVLPLSPLFFFEILHTFHNAIENAVNLAISCIYLFFIFSML